MYVQPSVAVYCINEPLEVRFTSTAVDGQLPAATGSGFRFSAIAINLTNAVRIVPNGADQINGVAAPYSFLAVRESRIFIDAAAGHWDAIG